FNTLLAPIVFTRGILEYPIALVLACLLRANAPRSRTRLKTAVVMLGALAVAAILFGILLRGTLQNRTVGIAIMVGLMALTLPYFVLSARSVWLAAAVALLLTAGQIGLARPGELFRARTFFGVYKVRLDRKANVHSIVHGSTTHGEQSLDPAQKRRPTSYYSVDGPIGQAFTALGSRLEGADIGVVGLGAGAMAGHLRPGQRWTFYEIDPAVLSIASSPQYF